MADIIQTILPQQNDGTIDTSRSSSLLRNRSILPPCMKISYNLGEEIANELVSLLDVTSETAKDLVCLRMLQGIVESVMSLELDQIALFSSDQTAESITRDLLSCSAAFQVIQNSIDIAVALLHRQGKADLLLLRASSNNKRVSLIKEDESKKTKSSVSYFDVLDMNPHLYSTTLTSLEEIIACWQNNTEDEEETKLVLVLDKLEKVHSFDHISPLEWAVLGEILKKGLFYFATKLNNHCSSCESPAFRFLQLHLTIIQSLEEYISQCNALFQNLLLTLHDIFRTNMFVLTKRYFFLLQTPLEEFVGQLVFTCQNIAQDMVVRYSPLSNVLSDMEILETIRLLLCIFQISPTEEDDRFLLTPQHLFAALDPHAFVMEMWIRQMPPHQAGELLISTNILKDLIRNSNATTVSFSFDTTGTTSIYCDVNETESSKCINMLSSPSTNASSSGIDINNMNSVLVLWSLSAVRAVICSLGQLVFCGANSSDVKAILQPFLSILRSGITTSDKDEPYRDHLAQISSDVIESVLSFIRCSCPSDCNKGILFSYILLELISILRTAQSSATVFSNAPLSLLHEFLQHDSEFVLCCVVNANSIALNAVELCIHLISKMTSAAPTIYDSRRFACSSGENDDLLVNREKIEDLIQIVSLLGYALRWFVELSVSYEQQNAILDSLNLFIEYGSELRLRREACVSIVTVFGSSNLGVAILDKLHCIQECLEYSLDDLLLLATATNSEDSLLYQQRETDNLLHAIAHTCQESRLGAVFITNSLKYQQFYSIIVTGNADTGALFRSTISFIILRRILESTLGGEKAVSLLLEFLTPHS